MKLTRTSLITRRTTETTTALLALLAFSTAVAQTATAPMLLDDYSDPKLNKHGVARLLVDDKAVGSTSTATQRCENGVLTVKGELVPGRGVPAFISHVSFLSANGKPKNLTGYTGVRLRVKRTKGILCVQVSSAERV